MTGKKSSRAAKQLENKINQPQQISDETVEKLRTWGFVKGKSGNPKGRTPGTVSLSTEIKNVASHVCSKTSLSYLHTLIIVMLVEAIEGNQETRQILFDRGFGTLIQKNVMMQLGGDVIKIAQAMGLDENDLRGIDSIRGLLNASEIDSADTFGSETSGGSEAFTTPATIEGQAEDG